MEQRATLACLEARKPYYEFAKRVMDVIVATVVLVLFAPVWVLIALLVRLTSPGPVFYAARAVGRHGREFTYYKFRSMVHANSDKAHRDFVRDYVLADAPYAIVDDPQRGQRRPVYKLINDDRITSVGRWLRRLSLDEIPQLYNVLRGEMSVVGPRPPVLHEYALYDDWAKQRLAVPPGITGLAQVRARARVSFRQMVALDLEYIQKRSLWFDIAIMLQTIPVVLSGKGAH